MVIDAKPGGGAISIGSGRETWTLIVDVVFSPYSQEQTSPAPHSPYTQHPTGLHPSASSRAKSSHRLERRLPSVAAGHSIRPRALFHLAPVGAILSAQSALFFGCSLQQVTDDSRL